jgi:hypothetical protein
LPLLPRRQVSATGGRGNFVGCLLPNASSCKNEWDCEWVEKENLPRNKGKKTR